MVMSEGISKTKMKASDFRFTRVRGWLGGDQTERIEGWKTYIYEAAGKMKAVNTIKVCISTSWPGWACMRQSSQWTLSSSYGSAHSLSACGLVHLSVMSSFRAWILLWSLCY